MKQVKALIHSLGRTYNRQILKREEEQQVFRNLNERPIEYRFALEVLGAQHPEKVLDVGTGTACWPRLLRDCGFIVEAIDNVKDYWQAGMTNPHWYVRDVDITFPGNRLQPAAYDAVTCISVLEHVVNHVEALRQMTNALKPGGILILTTPFSWSNPDPNVYRRPDALYGSDLPYICRSSSERELQQWLSHGLELSRRELWGLFTGPVWATGKRQSWKRAETEREPHQLGCFAFRKKS